MKCTYCGYENTRPGTSCASCGKEFSAPQPPKVGPNPMENILFPLLKDSLFLVVCILESAAAALSLIKGSGIPVFNILFTIFLWIVFANASKNTLHIGALKGLSGTVYAKYILQIISSVAGIVIGVLHIPISFAIEKRIDFFFELLEEIDFLDPILPFLEHHSQLFFILLGVYFIANGILALCVYARGWKRIHQFTKSVYTSAELYTTNVLFSDKAAVWLIAFAILRVPFAFFNLLNTNLLSVLSGSSSAAAMLLCGILLRKYFSKSAN